MYSFLFFCARRSIDFLDPENQPGSGSRSRALRLIENHQKYENKKEGLQNYLEFSINSILNIFHRSGYRGLDPEFGQSHIWPCMTGSNKVPTLSRHSCAYNLFLCETTRDSTPTFSVEKKTIHNVKSNVIYPRIFLINFFLNIYFLLILPLFMYFPSYHLYSRACPGGKESKI